VTDKNKTNKIRVLLVDDDRLTRKIYGDRLEEHGDIQVIGVPSGLEALHYLGYDPERGNLPEGHPVDVLVTDVMMARMDGWMLLDHLRKDMGLDEMTLPVIVISAYNSDELEVKAHLHRANAWQAKSQPKETVKALWRAIKVLGAPGLDPELTPVPFPQVLREPYEDDVTIPDMPSVSWDPGDPGDQSGGSSPMKGK